MVQQSGVLKRQLRRISHLMIVTATIVLAVFINVVISAIGRAAGGTFRFASPSGPAEVDALTAVGFTVVPLFLGMTVVALAVRVWPWVVPLALVVASAFALVTIPVMTLPAGFDVTSTITLALCHVAMVPTVVVGLLSLRAVERRGPHAPGRGVDSGERGMAASVIAAESGGRL
jgi:hypothetical protein